MHRAIELEKKLKAYKPQAGVNSYVVGVRRRNDADVWVAFINFNGMKKVSFSASLYGEDVAFLLACHAVKEAVGELVIIGKVKDLPANPNKKNAIEKALDTYNKRKGGRTNPRVNNNHYVRYVWLLSYPNGTSAWSGNGNKDNRHNSTYSINIYGNDIAFLLACQHVKKIRGELIIIGDVEELPANPNDKKAMKNASAVLKKLTADNAKINHGRNKSGIRGVFKQEHNSIHTWIGAWSVNGRQVIERYNYNHVPEKVAFMLACDARERNTGPLVITGDISSLPNNPLDPEEKRKLPEYRKIYKQRDSQRNPYRVKDDR